MNFDETMKAYYKERDQLGIGKRKPFTKRRSDICRCGHILDEHDYGAAFEKPCQRWDCECRDYHKARQHRPEQPAADIKQNAENVE